MTLWFVLAWFTRRRAQRQLQRQIDDLDQLSRGG